MLTPLMIYALLVLSVLVALLVIVLLNLAILPTITSHDYRPPSSDGQSTRNPRVAILVPARNEETNIEGCLDSLLWQDYPNLEVWVYDDASTDRTVEILARMQQKYAPHGSAPSHAPSRPDAYLPLHVVNGTEPPPPGWLGKASACHRLYTAMRARSEPDYVLFTDADVRFEPSAVSGAVGVAQQRNAGLLSIFPRQIMASWAERLAVPILSHFTVYNFLPLPLAFTLWSGTAFAAANGQFMFFSRQAYEACGGHTSVRSEMLEDVAFARAVKRAGFPALLADGGPLIHTRMYSTPAEVWRGYSKNVYAFFGYSPFFLAMGIVGLLALYVLPVVLAAGFLPSLVGFVFLAQYLVAVVTRLVLSLRFDYPLPDALFQPLAMVYVIAIAINSMIWVMTGKGAWKGRAVKADQPDH